MTELMPNEVKWWRPKSAPFVYASSVPRWLDRTKAYPGVVLAERPGVVRLFRDLDATGQGRRIALP